MKLLNDELIPVGKIIKPYGIKGWLKVKYFSANFENFTSLESLFVKKEEVFYPYRKEGLKKQKGFFVLKFAGIDSIDDAKDFCECLLYSDRASFLSLKKGEFYLTDLIGLKVVDLKKGDIGKIESFIDISHDKSLLVVRKGKDEVLIPLVGEFIKNVNIKDEVILVEVPEGLD